MITHIIAERSIDEKGLFVNEGIIGLINLLYNMCRYEQIARLNLLSIKK